MFTCACLYNVGSDVMHHSTCKADEIESLHAMLVPGNIPPSGQATRGSSKIYSLSRAGAT